VLVPRTGDRSKLLLTVAANFNGQSVETKGVVTCWHPYRMTVLYPIVLKTEASCAVSAYVPGLTVYAAAETRVQENARFATCCAPTRAATPAISTLVFPRLEKRATRTPASRVFGCPSRNAVHTRRAVVQIYC